MEQVSVCTRGVAFIVPEWGMSHPRLNTDTLPLVRAAPLSQRVHPLLDAVRVDVALADQALPGLDHGLDAVQVELHGGGEVLVLLDGRLHRLHRGGELHVGQG